MKAGKSGGQLRVEEELRARARQQAAVAELGQRALTGMELSRLLDETVALLAGTLEVEFAEVLELLPDGSALCLRAGIGWREGFVGHATVSAGTGSQAGYTLLAREPVIVEDLRAESRFTPPPLLQEHGIISGMTVILHGHQRPFGILGMHTGRPRRFTQDDIHFLQAAANVLAAAIERQRRDEALRESEERFRAIYEQAAVGIKQVGLDGQLLEVNQKLCEILNYPRELLLRRTMAQITDPEDRPEEQRLLSRLLAGEIPSYAIEKRYLRRDGTPVWVKVSSSLARGSGGEPAYRIAVVEDIHERKQAEAAVRQLTDTLEQRVRERTAELQAAYAELEAFSYTVSHDLRAPLRAVQGFADILLEDYSDRLEAAGREYADRIVAAAQRMDGMIQDLLAYSRLGRMPLALQPVSLDAAVREALAQLEADLRERAAELTVEPPLPAVIAHRPTLIQIVTNLISNAITFVAPGVTPRVRIAAEPRDGAVRLGVEDNGIGIAPEHQEQILKVFERLHGTEEYPGTGIGLAIVRRGVERMGGRMGLESQRGGGSRFWIELPRTEEPA